MNQRFNMLTTTFYHCILCDDSSQPANKQLRVKIWVSLYFHIEYIVVIVCGAQICTPWMENGRLSHTQHKYELPNLPGEDHIFDIQVLILDQLCASRPFHYAGVAESLHWQCFGPPSVGGYDCGVKEDELFVKRQQAFRFLQCDKDHQENQEYNRLWG